MFGAKNGAKKKGKRATYRVPDATPAPAPAPAESSVPAEVISPFDSYPDPTNSETPPEFIERPESSQFSVLHDEVPQEASPLDEPRVDFSRYAYAETVASELSAQAVPEEADQPKDDSARPPSQSSSPSLQYVPLPVPNTGQWSRGQSQTPDPDPRPDIEEVPSEEPYREPSPIDPPESGLDSDLPYVRQRRALLDIIGKLHSTGVQRDLDLPKIAVVGSQSVGKSSLIENMSSGMTLPRDSGTCTRCPMECRLECAPGQWSCRVSLRFTLDQWGNALGEPKEVEFGPIITDKSAVEARLRRAQRAILRPSLAHHLFLNDSDFNIPDPPPLSFSQNCVCVSVTGPNVPDLYFYDLPGVIANVRDGSDPRDIKLVQDMVKSYVSKENCLILLAVSCETDFENQGAGRLVLQADPFGSRTVGVLTKPDRIERHTGDRWVAMIQGRESHLHNGWYCVKQPNAAELREKIPWSTARANEQRFFRTQEPWKSMPVEYRDQLGSGNLIRHLAVLLSDLISQRLPALQQDIRTRLEDINAQIRSLPAPSTEDPSNALVRMILQFSQDVSRHVKGIVQKHREPQELLQAIRAIHKVFKADIVKTTPKFCSWDQNTLGSTSSWENDPAFLSAVDKSDFNERIGPHIYLDEVMEFAERAVTRELPGVYPFSIKEAYITDFLSEWEGPTNRCLASVHAVMSRQMKRIADAHFSRYTGGLHAKVAAIIREQLALLYTETQTKIDGLRTMECLPFTLNAQYVDLRDKFMSHFRDVRRQSQGLQGIINKLHNPVGSNHTYINNVTQNLQYLGFSDIIATDLHRLLPPDPMDPALDIMATVRAYFQVSSKRYTDVVPLEIDQGLVRGFEKNISMALIVGLGIGDRAKCGKWMEEPPEIVKQRRDLKAAKKRLEAARDEITSFSLPTT